MKLENVIKGIIIDCILYENPGCKIISLFVINLAHAHKRFRTATSAFLSNVYLNNTSVNMSKRESLNKLRVNCLKELAKDQGIDVKKKKKEDLISDILTCQLPAAVLTPVIAKSVPEECVSPSAVEIENLPPYNAVRYTDNFTGNIPTISFSDIYNFMILRPKSTGGSANNFKGLDRAVKHFEAGDIQEIGVAEVGIYR